MAPPAAERSAGALRARFAELVTPTPARAEFAFRLALICTLTTLVAQTYETQSIALSTYLVFFMNKPDRTSSILGCVLMTILISVLIAVLMLIAAAALDQPALRVAIMALLSLVLIFLSSASKLKPFAATIALILAYALDSLGSVPEGELATRALLYVWLMIGIPAGVSIVVNLLIGPAPRRMATRAIALRLRAVQALLVDPTEAARHRVATLRRQGGLAIQGLIHLALMEKVSPRADLLALQQAVRSSETLLMLAEAIDQQGDAPSAWRASVGATLAEMAAILDRDLYPVDIGPLAPSAVSPAVPSSVSLDTVFENVLATFAGAPAQPAAAPPKPVKGFLLPDAFSNPDHVRHAIKVTLAAMGCYLFYSLADWPGIHTCLITCYIVALDTTAETVEKLSLRIVGALVGAGVGLAAIVWVTPHFDRIGGLLALVFAGGLTGGWIAAGGPRIGYAGLQVAFAFFLCVVQGTSPAFDLTVARDRVIGILIGNAVIYLMFVSIWPVSIARRIDPAIASLFRTLGRTARMPDHGGRRDALATARAATSGVETQLGLAGYEPAAMRPGRDWFARRHAALAMLTDTETTLLFTNDRSELDALAERLDHAAVSAERGEAPDAVWNRNTNPEQTFAC